MIYWFCRTAVYLWLHIRFRIKIEGMENIPEGSCILGMNHTSNYDPLMVGSHVPRKMHIMAKEELFRNRIFAWLLSKFGAFPVKRGQADVKSLKQSLRLLQEGKIFAIFLEGTRSKTEEMQDPKKGIGFLVGKSEAPVIPTYIYGVKKGWRQQAGIVYGKPMTFAKGMDYTEIATAIAEAIKQLQHSMRH
ncbi:lysophospholipid acyltransferase family protein [Brevibacillus fulvus]|uniref:1-acyl-sn-glycerol-3-phosphate acyltransferase n=1 Tax=Brevibacillus fulvus TaxID=1125967 RepID=A0A938Y4U9_9BACL|nr:lysophospholipid acyltransferase family protein [Brevibacillus fulvus]MBM7591265.1 1-acyl-sn-glycerol-3-phosphate acyltransferase [Brevibacillus fulvus]